MRGKACSFVVFALTSCQDPSTSPPSSHQDAATVRRDASSHTPQDASADSGPSPEQPTDASSSEGGSSTDASPSELSDSSVATTSDASSDSSADAASPPNPIADAGRDAASPDLTDATAVPREPDGGGLAPDAAIAGRLVFVTSERYSGGLGGLEGADDICQMHAQAAGLVGTYQAWLSTLEQAVGERLPHSALPYVRTDGVIVATDWDDLLDGALLAPIDHDEFAQPRLGDVWTGTLASGVAYDVDDCGGFLDPQSGMAQCGSSTASNTRWTENLVPFCYTQLHLYCFQM